jgi:hypothetical protein
MHHSIIYFASKHYALITYYTAGIVPQIIIPFISPCCIAHMLSVSQKTKKQHPPPPQTPEQQQNLGNLATNCL